MKNPNREIVSELEALPNRRIFYDGASFSYYLFRMTRCHLIASSVDENKHLSDFLPF